MEEIYRENVYIVYHFLYKQCQDRELAEELTQETFYRAMKSLHRYDGSCKMSVWLCSIARHLYYQHLRKYGREIPTQIDTELLPDPADTEQQVLSKLELQEVLEEMKQLPELTRRVMVLRSFGGLSFREIGEILGKSENWARVTFYRGKERLLAKSDQR